MQTDFNYISYFLFYTTSNIGQNEVKNNTKMITENRDLIEKIQLESIFTVFYIQILAENYIQYFSLV